MTPHATTPRVSTPLDSKTTHPSPQHDSTSRHNNTFRFAAPAQHHNPLLGFTSFQRWSQRHCTCLGFNSITARPGPTHYSTATQPTTHQRLSPHDASRLQHTSHRSGPLLGYSARLGSSSHYSTSRLLTALLGTTCLGYMTAQAFSTQCPTAPATPRLHYTTNHDPS